MQTQLPLLAACLYLRSTPTKGFCHPQRFPYCLKLALAGRFLKPPNNIAAGCQLAVLLTDRTCAVHGLRAKACIGIMTISSCF